MNRRNKWLAYDEIAWTEQIIAPPNEYAEETEFLVNAIEEHAKIKVKTLLHLGCGAGGNDCIFKRRDLILLIRPVSIIPTTVLLPERVIIRA